MPNCSMKMSLPSIGALPVLGSFVALLKRALCRLSQKARPRKSVILGITVDLGQHVLGERDVDAHGLSGFGLCRHEDGNPVAIAEVFHHSFEAGGRRNRFFVLDQPFDMEGERFLRQSACLIERPTRRDDAREIREGIADSAEYASLLSPLV